MRALGIALLLGSLLSPASAQSLRLVFDVHAENSEQFATQKTDPASPDPPPTSDGELTLVLGASRLRTESEGATVLIDFEQALERPLAPDAATYDEFPILGVADGASAELYNRTMMRGALAAGGVLEQEEAKAMAAALEPFELASLFSLPPPVLKGMEPEPAPVLVDDEHGFSLHRGGETVVSVRWSEVRVPDELRATWGRALQHLLRVHPVVRERLARAEFLPAEVSSRVLDMQKRTSMSLKLRESGPGDPASLELPAQASRRLGVDEPLRAVLEAAWTAAQTPPVPVAEEADRIELEVTALLSAGPPLDAALTAFEAAFMSGVDVSGTLERHRDVFGADAAFNTFVSSIGQGDEETCRASLAGLDSLDRSKLKKAWVLDIFRANLLVGLHKMDEARALQLAALRENPRLVGVLHDLGWGYVRQWDIVTGWRCWAAARRLRPEHPQLEDVRRREATLHAEAASFF